MPIMELQNALSRPSPVMRELNYLLQLHQPLQLFLPVSPLHIEEQENIVEPAVVRLHGIKKTLGEQVDKQISRLQEEKSEEEQRGNRTVKDFHEKHQLFLRNSMNLKEKVEDGQRELVRLWVSFIEGARFLYHTAGVKSCDDVHYLLLEAWLFQTEKAQMQKLFGRAGLHTPIKDADSPMFREFEQNFRDNVGRARREIDIMFNNAERLEWMVSSLFDEDFPAVWITPNNYRASAGELIWPILRGKDRAARLAPARRSLGR
ncbi:MAG: hypothetical protein Q9228_001286 [Teloschistes exilis]